MMFQDTKEKKIFFRNFGLTLCGFILAIIIQIFFVLDQPDPKYIFIPLIVGTLVGTLFGYNGILRRRLSQSNQAKSDFLSRMSHELRTPLTSIIGFSQIVRHKPELDEESRNQVERIFRAGEHLLGLIEDLLEFSRIEAGKLKMTIQPIASNELMKECISMVEPMAHENSIKIENKLSPEETIMLKVDPLRARQVVMNLLSNAVKYNKPNGKIILSSELNSRGHWCLSVEDTGNGIAAEDFPIIFDYFERLEKEDKNIEGTGIGLAISKHLVEIMQGEIGLESVPGEGSRFWVEWPTV